MRYSKKFILESKVAFLWSVLATQKELVLTSLNVNVQGHTYIFPNHISPNSCTFADQYGRTDQL